MAERKLTPEGQELIFDRAVAADGKNAAAFLAKEAAFVVDPVYLERVFSESPAFHVSDDAGTIALAYSKAHAPDIIEIVDLFVSADYQDQGVEEEILALFEKEAMSWGHIIVFATDDTFWKESGYEVLLATANSFLVHKDVADY